MKKNIVVVGAGKIGSTIAEMLASTGDYGVTLVDPSAAQ
ncbi:saccharopine dehydrogenase NADP-binding domain-containing protein, partial [Mesorhizobium sp. M4B.F.Ca.ET.049.02.1.2]